MKKVLIIGGVLTALGAGYYFMFLRKKPTTTSGSPIRIMGSEKFRSEIQQLDTGKLKNVVNFGNITK